MNPSGYKTVTSGPRTHDRAIVNMEAPLELGIEVPMIDSKFLTSYRLLSTTGTYLDATHIPITQTMGKEITDRYIYDFDEKLVAAAYLGPSSYPGYRESYDIRPIRKFDENTLEAGYDILAFGSSMRVPLANGDTVICARRPQGMVETSSRPTGVENEDLPDQLNTLFTIRKPKILNVNDHANTMLGHFPASHLRYLSFPITAQGTINPIIPYRFSFYYRVFGTMSIRPIVDFFTNVGTYISSKVFSPYPFNGSATEDSDFSFFDIMISEIPRNARRLRVVLSMTSFDPTIIESAYPILEHAMANSPTATMYLPEHPSMLSYKDVHSSELRTSFVGTNYPFDTTRLFFGHTGRKLFDVNMAYSLADSNTLNELRIMENMNERGATIVLRPQHNDLPPVLLGNLQVNNSMPLYDYHYNDLTLKFMETD